MKHNDSSSCHDFTFPIGQHPPPWIEIVSQAKLTLFTCGEFSLGPFALNGGVLACVVHVTPFSFDDKEPVAKRVWEGVVCSVAVFTSNYIGALDRIIMSANVP